MDQQAILFAAALGLRSPWEIKSVNLDVQGGRLDIDVDFIKGSKFDLTDKGKHHQNLAVHDTSEKRWRHLNFFQFECYINARVPRVKLPDGKVVQITTPWEGKHSGFTMLFEAFVLMLIKQMPVHKVVEMFGAYDAKIWSLIDMYVSENQETRDLSKVTKIGLDETSLGGHNYITSFVDLDKKECMYVAKGKDHSTIAEFVAYFKAQKGDPQQIKVVSCDMSPAFIKGINEHFTQAEIVFDKFHIIKLINTAVDTIRRKEVKVQPVLLKNRFVFLKNSKNRTDKQNQYIQKIEAEHYMLKTFKAMRFRETFQALYQSPNELVFYSGINKWIKLLNDSGISELRKLAKTINGHLDGIITWFDYRVSNAILEGINSVFKAALAKARGYKTFKNAKNILLILTSDIVLPKLTLG